MRIASLIPLALALGAVLVTAWIVLLIGRAYDQEITTQLPFAHEVPVSQKDSALCFVTYEVDGRTLCIPSSQP